MKTRLIRIGICLLALGISPVWAQEYKEYDIGAYRLPDITRNELDFSLNSKGSFSDYTGAEETGSSFNGDFGVRFNRYRNARAFRGTHEAGVSISGDYDKDYEGKKWGDYSLGLFYTNSSRFYGDDHKGLFFETGGTASFNVKGEKTFGRVEETRKNTSKEVNLSIPLRVGKGRIERVEDARQAIYILENLSRRKVLSRKLTDGEIDEFARLISTVKNKRFFDARLRMIDEVTAVDSFLVRSGALASGGASYFTTLYDYWMYGDLFERKSGTEISGGVTPGFMYDASDSPDPSFYESRFKAASVQANLSLDYQKPLNMYWQNSAEAFLTGGYMRRDERIKDHSRDETEYKRNDYAVRLGGRYAFGYYPNSRTNINLGIEEVLGWDQLKWDEPELESRSYVSTNTSLTLDLYYYFSPQLRLAATANLTHRYKGDEAIDYYTRWQGNFALTLTYSLF